MDILAKITIGCKGFGEKVGEGKGKFREKTRRVLVNRRIGV